MPKNPETHKFYYESSKDPLPEGAYRRQRYLEALSLHIDESPSKGAEIFSELYRRCGSTSDKIRFLQAASQLVDQGVDEHDAGLYQLVDQIDSVAETAEHPLIKLVAEQEIPRQRHAIGYARRGPSYNDEHIQYGWVMDMQRYLANAPKSPALDKAKESKKETSDSHKDIYAVAPDALGVFEGGSVEEIVRVDANGVVRPLETDNDTIDLLEIIHDAEIAKLVDHQIGVRVDRLPIDEQMRLLTYMNNATPKDYVRLCVAIQNAQEPETLARAFLATEFGSDYGDLILTIAEKIPSEQSQRVFETISRFRMRTHEFAYWFHDYDPEFALATEHAMNERLTDALSAMEELALKGTLHVDVAPHRAREDYVDDGRFMCDVKSLDEGIRIIENLEKSMGLIHDIISAPDVIVTHINENEDQFIMYRFTSQTYGTALLYVRREGARAYDKNHEYGNGKGVEASISFIVNPTNPHHLRSDKDPDGVSLRFDREGRMVDESPFVKDRDPTREDGTLSVDISSVLGDASRTPVKIGRLIAAGNLLRATKVGSHESLHHNTNYFDQTHYGKAGGFAKLAIYTAHMAEAMLRLQSQGSHASTYQTLPGVLNSVAERSAA